MRITEFTVSRNGVVFPGRGNRQNNFRAAYICKMRKLDMATEDGGDILKEMISTKQVVLQALDDKLNKTKVKYYNCGKAGQIQRNWQ